MYDNVKILLFLIFHQALPHALLWRGDKMKTVGKLMVEMWRAEEMKLGVKRDQYGVISGKEFFFFSFQKIGKG